MLIPWLDLITLFIYIAGFVIGLGAVTVIGWQGFLGRKSGYWTESAIRTHKVTKPLIWVGLGLAVIGAALFYRHQPWTDVRTIQVVVAGLLIANGLFLSLVVSPFLLSREKEGRMSEILPADWQLKISLSFIISWLAWWSELFFLVWQLIVY
jgi:hypothetical protein